MTFTFPNPADTTEFKGDNGITYAWDVDDKKWQVKAFKQGLDLRKPLTAVATKYKDYDNPDEPQIVICFFPNGSQDGVQNVGFTEVRLYNFYLCPHLDKGWIYINDTRYTVHHTEEWSTGPVFVLDTKEGNLEPLYVGEEVTVHNFEKGDIKEYVDAADRNLQLQIDELEQEIDVIAPRLDGAQFKYVATPAVKPGEMHIQSGSFTAPTDLVFFNDQALDGVTHGWGDLHVHDYLEITDTQEQLRTAQNYAMYMVTKEPEGTGLKQIEVALVKGSGAPTVDDVLDAKGFQLAGGEISDLDDRYMRKDAYNTRLYRQEFVNSYGAKDWKTYSPAPGTFELAVNGSYSWETNQSLAFRDLYDKFPPDEWMFVPGFVSALEMNSWSGFQYAPRWQMRMDNIPRFDAEGQVLRGWWRGDSPTNTAGKMYLRFECFRRK